MQEIFTTNVPKILDLKSSSEQIISKNWRWLPLNSVIQFISIWKYRKIHVDFHFVFTLMFVSNFLLCIYRVFPICMAFFHITSRLKKMEMQMEYFFWTAMPWVCLDITMPFSTICIILCLLVLPSQSILLFAAVIV